jgi:hypothetical protein
VESEERKLAGRLGGHELAELSAPGWDEAHAGKEGSSAGGVADSSDAEEAGDELIIGQPDGEAAAGELGRQ